MELSLQQVNGGKFKTVSQMIMSVLLMVNIPLLSPVTVIFVWLAVILTIVSLIDYIVKNYKVLTEGSM
jgi:CDP-diacylglycerol--glycerol-3-phosphate 3-phosphatidyltransferase